MHRIARTALAAAAGTAAVLGTTRAASADQTPILVAQHGAHSFYVSYDEPYDVEDHTLYWDFVPLGGMCGFAGTKLVLSNMTETYFIQTNPQTGSFAGIGKILNEWFELTQYDAAGNVVKVYAGTGDEYAQFRGTGAQGQLADQSVNLRVMFRGESEDGTRLSFSIKMRLRANPETGEVTRFDAAVDGCHLR